MRQHAAILITVLICLTARSADPTAPAEFRILSTVAQPNPGAFTATIGDIPGDRQLFPPAAFEPLCFRTKVQAAGDAADEVILPPTHHLFSTFRSGFWDGAQVRVYRIRNARLVKIREDTVANGGFISTRPQLVSETRSKFVAANTPDPRGAAAPDPFAEKPNSPLFRRVYFQKHIARVYRTGVRYHFAVSAVTKDGRESRVSTYASLMLSAAAHRPATPRNTFVSPRRFHVNGVDERVAQPNGVKAEVDRAGMMTLSWEPSKAGNILGYRVYVSDTPPDKQRGCHLRLSDAKGPLVKNGDMAFLSHAVTTMSRLKHIHPYRYQAGETARGHRLFEALPDEMPNGSWARVPHPGPLPKEFTDAGETCLQLNLKDATPFGVGTYAFAGISQTWYPVLQPGRTYVAEGWVRYTGKGGGQVLFRTDGRYTPGRSEGAIPPATFQVGDTWRRIRTTFTPPRVITERGVGKFEFTFTGPGTFWIDNLRIYPEEPGYLHPEPLVVERTRDSHLAALRFHTHIKSRWSNTMEWLTNPPGVIGNRGALYPNSPFTLPSLLGFCETVGTNPWLQIEMGMSEREWLGLMEYLAAPYDPNADRPQTKPWAHKRFAQGHPRPWTETFDRLYFEISNETWNGLFGPWNYGWGETMVDEATGKSYRWGSLHGMLQEYVLGVLKSSPYWTDAFAAKFHPVLGGWGAQPRTDGFGALAIQSTPSTEFLTIGGYNGGWDEGEQPAEPTDPGYFRALTFWPQNLPRTLEHVTTRNALLDGGLAKPFRLGTYEAGPGYALSGLNNQARMTPEQVEAQDRVGKSLAMGTATLDAFLGRAMLGFGVQNFFTLNFKRTHWTSHAPVYKGGQPYPSWMSLALYNREGTGDFLKVETVSAPTRDLPGYRRRAAVKDAPLAAVYATRRADRVNVFVLSRKIDGYPDAADDGFTPVTLRLPFTTARQVTLWKITGDPRAHNLDAWVVKEERREGIPFANPFHLTAEITGEKKDGLPPAGILLFVFEGAH